MIPQPVLLRLFLRRPWAVRTHRGRDRRGAASIAPPRWGFGSPRAKRIAEASADRGVGQALRSAPVTPRRLQCTPVPRAPQRPPLTRDTEPRALSGHRRRGQRRSPGGTARAVPVGLVGRQRRAAWRWPWLCRFQYQSRCRCRCGSRGSADPGGDPGAARAPRDISSDAMGAALAAYAGPGVTAAGGPAAGEVRRARAAPGGCPELMAESGICARGRAEGARHGPGPAFFSSRSPAGLRAQPGRPGPAGDPALTAGPSRGGQAPAAPSVLWRAGGGF